MTEIQWDEHAVRLSRAAAEDYEWYAQIARELVREGDRVAADVGCGGAGMAKALAEALPPDSTVVAIDETEEILEEARRHGDDRITYRRASLADGAEALLDAIGGPADIVWASAVVHHLPDQQAAVDTLAKLLAPGGRLALAEGGLPARHLPWDVGVGEPGLEIRLHAAQNSWFAAMRAALPDSVPMPYGWPQALIRAGLEDVTTRTVLIERPTPLTDDARAHVVDKLRWQVENYTDPGHVAPEDLDAWNRLLDPNDPSWLGHRTDLTDLQARSIHVGIRRS